MACLFPRTLRLLPCRSALIVPTPLWRHLPRDSLAIPIDHGASWSHLPSNRSAACHPSDRPRSVLARADRVAVALTGVSWKKVLLIGLHCMTSPGHNGWKRRTGLPQVEEDGLQFVDY